MRRRSLRLLSLLLLSALAGCSYSTDFVIVNDSGSPVEVRYTFKPRHPPEQPAKKPLDKLEDDTPWRTLSEGEFAYDMGSGAVTLTLGPGEALRACRHSGWRGHGDLNDDESFDLESVRIEGANGAVQYEGRQAQYQFRWEHDQLYKLTYYGWGDKR
jgi:hypothetical protein